jgi:hypothetical protein
LLSKSAFCAVEPERLEGDVGVLHVARLGIGETDFWVQFDAASTRTPSAAARPSALVLTVDDPGARRVQKS